MASDTDWVADVRRWVMSSQRESRVATVPAERAEDFPVGYEAAQPALQSRHWIEDPIRGMAGPA